MEKLLFCPICGADAVVLKDNDSDLHEEFRSWGIACTECTCSVSSFSTSADAVRHWNDRRPVTGDALAKAKGGES